MKLKYNGENLFTNDVKREMYNGYGIVRKACHGLHGYLYGRFPGYNYEEMNRQPCLSDTQYIQITIDFYLEFMAAQIALGRVPGKDVTMLDVSQYDNDNFCHCRICRAQEAIDGSVTGPTLCFTNAVAQEIGKVYPEVYVGMLAYGSTCVPPKETVPLKNVAISYCFYIDGGRTYCSNHCLSGVDCTGETNRLQPGSQTINNNSYAVQLEKWCEISSFVNIWYYPGIWLSFGMPSSTVYTIREDMKYLASLGVDGLFTCPGYSPYGDGIIEYMIMRVLWDADMSDADYDGYIKGYLEANYGDGWEYIWEYMQMQVAAKEDLCWTNMGWNLPDERIDFDYYLTHYEEMCDLFENAIALAETNIQKTRIEWLSLSMHFTGLTASHTDQYLNGSAEERTRYKDHFDYFIEIGLKYNFQLGYDPEFGLNYIPENYSIEQNPASWLTLGNSYQWWLD